MTKREYRYFNRLRRLREREWPCPSCELGEIVFSYNTPRANEMATTYKCTHCGHSETYP